MKLAITSGLIIGMAMFAGFVFASLVLTAYVFWSIGMDGAITLTEPNLPVLYAEIAISSVLLLVYLIAMIIIWRVLRRG